MITIRKSEERGHADHGWLNAYHTFSFADYYDPRNMGFRSLRVINDDTVLGGGGFDTHPHRDMEIVTYILSGELEHRDSMGNGRVIRPGEFQYMAAGTGVSHSEFNHSPIEPVHLLQIWMMPERKGLAPRYEERNANSTPTGRLQLITSKAGRDGSIKINQDADLYLAKLNAGDHVTHAVAPGRHVWVHVATGGVTLNGNALKAGDGAALNGESAVEITASQPSQTLVFDLN